MTRIFWFPALLLALLPSCALGDKGNMAQVGDTGKMNQPVSRPLLTSLDDIKEQNNRKCVVVGHIDKGPQKDNIFFVASFGRVRITEDVGDELLRQKGDTRFVVTARYIEKREDRDAPFLVGIDYFSGKRYLHYFTDVRLLKDN